jgi:2-dehydro-3-deoxyglucarate aldolase/4-hydroxy-2-oxoheptanedioate aldolase
MHLLVAVADGAVGPVDDRGVVEPVDAVHGGALDRADDEVLGIVQIESARAVDEVDKIAAIDGVDVLFVGPRDLSHDLGVPGNVTAPVFRSALDRVRAAASEHGKACGLLVPDGEAAAARRAEGWSFIAIGSDSALLASALITELRRSRSA